MESFKINEEWRRNETDRAIQYFDCRLLSWLTKVEMSGQELADTLGVSRTMVDVWCRGVKMPPTDIQELITQIVGAPDRTKIWTWKNPRIKTMLLELNRQMKKVNLLKKEISEEINLYRRAA